MRKSHNLCGMRVTELSWSKVRAFEVWLSYKDYGGILMQSSTSGMWACTHNAYLDPNDPRFKHSKPSAAMRVHLAVFPENADAALEPLDLLSNKQWKTQLEGKAPKAPDTQKLLDKYNDPFTSEGVKRDIARKLAAMGVQVQ